MRYQGLVAGAGLVLFACCALAADAAISGCETKDGLEPICGLPGSEDLAVLPGDKKMFVSLSRIDSSRLPDMVWMTGGIALLDLVTKQSRVVYPVKAPVKARTAGDGDWGDTQCPGEIGERLAPHGLHLSQRGDGKWQLLVVNHGGRESIEMFEVTGNGKQLGLAWRGCAVAPAHSFLNDVVALPQGGFLTTNMTNNTGPDSMMKDRARAARGENTGHVWQWQRAAGYRILPGSETPMPNGLEVDQSGDTLYINVGVVVNGGVRKVDIKSGKQLGYVTLSNPDNISWAADGRLLVAGSTKRADVLPCMKAGFSRPCGAEFYVAAVDTETMVSETLLVHAGAPMGGATVAVQAGDHLYVGSFAGDRILKAPVAIEGGRRR